MQKQSSLTVSHAIGEVSSAWSIAEFGMSRLLMELLPADELTTMAVSTGLDYSRRRDLINSLGQLKLQQSRTQFTSLMSELGGLSKERNAVIHGIFATIDGVTQRMNINNRGVLAWKESKDSVRRIMGLATNIAKVSNKMTALSALIRSDVKAWQETHRQAFAPPEMPLLVHRLVKIPDKH